MTLFNTRFVPPDFRTGDIELRVEAGGVRIYGSRAGLEKLILLCQKLLDSREDDHLHLQDYCILTKQSEPAVLALFSRHESEGDTDK